MKVAAVGWLGLVFAAGVGAAEPVTAIQDTRITGGLIAQVGTDDLALGELGERFHVRLLLADSAAVGRAQAAIDEAGLTGRFTADVWTGYDMDGARADMLVSDGSDLYMMKSRFTPALEPVHVRRTQWTGLTPMGGQYLMANFGLLNDTMFHRAFWVYDDTWPGYSTGTGYAARAGNLVVLGAERAYAAKHFEGGWYPTHKPGSGNRIVADGYDHSNTAGNRTTPEMRKQLDISPNAAAFVRTAAPLWDATVPIIVRAMLVAPDGAGGELVFTAGIVEGTTRADWDQSTYYVGPGKLMVHNGADDRLLAQYDLSAADGRLLISLIDGRLLCLRPAENLDSSPNARGEQE